MSGLNSNKMARNKIGVNYFLLLVILFGLIASLSSCATISAAFIHKKNNPKVLESDNGDAVMKDDNSSTHTDIRSGNERRLGIDRRTGVDTRPKKERQIVGNRRSDKDRRSGVERRS